MLTPLRCLGLALIVLTGCATDISAVEKKPKLTPQNLVLTPSNGGELVAAHTLRPGDIVLTADNGLRSAGIRLATLSPVSHAAIYMGQDQVAEAVGEGIRLRSMPDLLNEEVTVVAFRHPQVNGQHIAKMDQFVQAHLGQKYNYVGIMLQAPFTIERRFCELPLVPTPIRDFCLRGVAAIQLGLGRNDQFFCSQFVLEAFKRADLPLTDADPRMMNPGDLMHMREGDVPSVISHQPLQYVGHLKAPPTTAAPG